MTRFLIATPLACVLAVVTVAAAGQDTAAKDPKLGTKITIRGCLHEGKGTDSFVLLNLTERPAVDGAANVIMPDAPPSANRTPLPIYWLRMDSTNGLKERIGQIIDITGEVQEKKT